MATRQKKKKKPEKFKKIEISGLILIALGIFLFVGMFTNSIGIVGKTIKLVLFGTFGIMAYVTPLLLAAFGSVIIVSGHENIKWFHVTVWMFFGAFASALIQLFYLSRINIDTSFLNYTASSYELGQAILSSGGAVGAMIVYPLWHLVDTIGTVIFLIASMLAILLLMTRFSLRKISVDVRDNVKDLGNAMVERQEQRQQGRRGQKLFIDKLTQNRNDSDKKKADLSMLNASLFEYKATQPNPSDSGFSPRFDTEMPEPMGVMKQADMFDSAAVESIEPETHPKVQQPKAAAEKAKPGEAPPAEDLEYINPPFNLLTKAPKTTDNSAEEVNKGAALLVETLLSFGISTKVVNISRGPAITRYELQPAAGIKISRIVSLSNDIAMNMAAPGVRIEAPIPGKAAIGIEVPNTIISVVRLRDVLESTEFIKSEAAMSFCLGKDIAGKNIVADLAKMPHMLIAGATGSGKSVCINTIIISILYKSPPEQVRMIMIDPKVVELNVYNGIPHLLIPVVTDPKKAAGALNWAVQEMIRRYSLFAEKGARDLHRYNLLISEEEDAEKLPQIVIIIDELADLMMAAPNEVEDSICRLAQMARAAGMHLVIATQRPSVDVITGIIKANIPSRIAFAVSSQVDSRTILDIGGAEKLLGRGDMLFNPSGANKPLRVQGAYITEIEVEKVVEFIKEQHKEVDYDSEVISNVNAFELLSKGKGKGSDDDDGDSEYSERHYDTLLMDASDVVYDTGQASISMVQRKLRVGYARAARLVDELEELGIVSPSTGSKPRDILKTRIDATTTIEQYRG